MDVRVNLLALETTTAHVYYLYSTFVLLLHQDVLRLQVAVNDVELVEEVERLQDLDGESADQVQRKTGKVGLLDELVQVFAEDFELEASVPSEDERALETDYIVTQFWVMQYRSLQYFNLYFGLHCELLLIFDNLQRNGFLLLVIISLIHPSERSFAQQRNDLILVGNGISNGDLWIAFSISEIVKRRYPSCSDVKDLILLHFLSLKTCKLLLDALPWRIVDYRLGVEHLLILPLFLTLIFEEIVPFGRDFLAVTAAPDQYLIDALFFLGRVGGLRDLSYLTSYLFSVDAIGVGAFAGDAFEVERVLGFAKQEGVFEVEQLEDWYFGLSFSTLMMIYEDLPSDLMGLPPH